MDGARLRDELDKLEKRIKRLHCLAVPVPRDAQENILYWQNISPCPHCKALKTIRKLKAEVALARKKKH
jgi:hypothetical protein